jgi:glycosyltransferase involved in cell wall biosynthesis
MIDVLIPTYNREQDLIKNIQHLNRLVVTEEVERHFRILVSDNCSTDNTWDRLKDIESDLEIELIKFKQDTNTGLERNAVFLLQKATSEFVMYIGDDDYLPEGYLKFVVDTLSRDSLVGSIIPGIDALYGDGSTRPERVADFDCKKYAPGFFSALRISCFGHQLSGILLKRKGLERKYLYNSRYRNIYPFVFFLSYNNLRGTSYYAPMYKVLVTQSNSKDWGYDESGLLTEIFKNYNILFPENPFRRFLLSAAILAKQGSWRLRVGKQPFLPIKAIIHVWKSKSTDVLVKISLPPVVLVLYCRKLFLKFSKLIPKI